MKTKICIICNNEFKKNPRVGYKQFSKQKTCGKKECLSLLQSEKTKGFKNPMFGKTPYNKGTHKKSIKSKCLVCKVEFYYFKGNSDGKFCSKKCFGKHYSGKNNRYWNGGSPNSYYGKAWKNIRKEVIKKYDNKCQNCGTKHRLQVHHIIPFKKVGVHSLDNLIPLCISCHKREEWKIINNAATAKEETNETQ